MTYFELFKEVALVHGLTSEQVDEIFASVSPEEEHLLPFQHAKVPKGDEELLRKLLHDSYTRKEGLEDFVAFGDFCAKKKQKNLKNN